MSLILAPYNESMRLGQGFNSFTHEICIDRAVEITTNDIKTTTSTSQDVSYSSRFVERLSDVMETMNVSYSKAIKRGTVEIAGNTSTVDETTFKTSDLNAVVSVKVTNQTTTIQSNGTFKAMENIRPGTSEFNQVYGDCYISGFILGGSFTGILSVKASGLNPVKKVEDIRHALNPATGGSDASEFTLGSWNSSRQSQVQRALKDTQVTLSVSWVGGGQIKDEIVPWDFDSMYAAAAAFPARVAACPQRTWAILTKYNANRSFIEYTKDFKLAQMLQYDQVSTYTAQLFNSFMDYKLLLSTLQDVIAHRERYQKRKDVAEAIEPTMPTLLSARGAMRAEQAKIVQAIDVLARDPSILRRSKTWSATHQDPVVDKILKKALGGNWALNSNKDVAGSSQVPLSVSEAIIPVGKTKEEDFDFSSLVPPEFWQEFMPVLEPSFEQLPQAGFSKEGFSQTGLVPESDFKPITLNGFQAMPGTVGFNIAGQTPADAEAKQVKILKDKAMLQAELEKVQQTAEDAKKQHEEELTAVRGDRDAKVSELQATVSSLQKSLGEEKETIAIEHATITNKLNDVEKELATERETSKSLRESVARRDGDLNSLKETLKTETAEKVSLMRERDQARAFYLKPKPNENIWIMCIFWGDRSITDQGVIDRAYTYARSKQIFCLNLGWFNCDPIPGHPKVAIIFYQYNNTGVIRCIQGREGQNVQFDAN